MFTSTRQKSVLPDLEVWQVKANTVEFISSPTTISSTLPFPNSILRKHILPSSDPVLRKIYHYRRLCSTRKITYDQQKSTNLATQETRNAEIPVTIATSPVPSTPFVTCSAVERAENPDFPFNPKIHIFL